MEDSILDASALVDIAARGVGDADHARAIDEASRDGAMKWFEKLTSLAQRTSQTAPYIHCEVRLLHGHATLSRAGQMHLMALTGHGPAVSRAMIDATFQGVNETLQLARSLEHRELQLTAMQNLARAMDIFDRREEATVVATEALKLAELSGCAIHARQLKAFLTGEDRTAARLRQLQAMNSDSEEDIILNAGDDQLLFMATTIATANQLPRQRIPNVLRSLEARRQLSIERRDWCRDIAHGEFQQGDPSTMYSEPAPLKVFCMRFRHEALVQQHDTTQLTSDFRRQFCDRCLQRRPDSGATVDVSPLRNRAKAVRRKRRGK